MRYEDISAEATRRLKDSGRRALGKIICSFDRGVLCLNGQVSSFYLKQIAQTLVADVEGVIQIDNCLTVAKPR